MESFEAVRAALLPSLQLWEQTLSTPHTAIRLSRIEEKPNVFGFYAHLVFESQDSSPNPEFCYSFDIIEDEGIVILLGFSHLQKKQLELDFRIQSGIRDFFDTQAPKIAGVIHALCPDVFEGKCSATTISHSYPEMSLIY